MILPSHWSICCKDKTRLGPLKNGEELYIIIAAILSFNRIQHRGIGDPVVIKITNNRFSNAFRFLAFLFRRLSRDVFIDNFVVVPRASVTGLVCPMATKTIRVISMVMNHSLFELVLCSRLLAP